MTATDFGRSSRSICWLVKRLVVIVISQISEMLTPPACRRGARLSRAASEVSRSEVGLTARTHPRPLPQAGGEA